MQYIVEQVPKLVQKNVQTTLVIYYRVNYWMMT